MTVHISSIIVVVEMSSYGLELEVDQRKRLRVESLFFRWHRVGLHEIGTFSLNGVRHTKSMYPEIAVF
jgi:hypothetical protein